MKQEISIQEKENQVLQVTSVDVWNCGRMFFVDSCCVSQVIIYRKRQRDREQWRMQNAMTSLRLENVRNRISPHFIFNVLNREMNLHKGDKESQNLIGLTKLIRRNLELTDCLAVSLADELDFVDTYVKLERQSLGSEFEYRLDLAEQLDLQEMKVPSMLLQIPVENAIKHGLSLEEVK